MKVYDSVIIGSGYGAIGYASANKNSIVCEERQICDNAFYLPLRSFRYAHYEPKTAEGKALQGIFNDLSLFKETEQNTNGFEIALCKYISERPLNVLLKCRIISAERRDDGVFDVTVQTNAGLSHVFAKKILDTVPKFSAQKQITVLFLTTDIQSAKTELLSAFNGATVESAFYPNRYALHIPIENLDENTVKIWICQKWEKANTEAKILYIAPVFYGNGNFNELCDMRCLNPIEAFESGYFYAKKEAK